MPQWNSKWELRITTRFMPQEDSPRYRLLYIAWIISSILTVFHRQKTTQLISLEKSIEREWLMGRVAGGEEWSIAQTDPGNRPLTEQSLTVA